MCAGCMQYGGQLEAAANALALGALESGGGPIVAPTGASTEEEKS